jgi:ankyrin repeat protein
MASAEEQEDFLLSCRYGDLDDVKIYLDKFGSDNLLSIRDDNGSTCLHMAAGNGHNGMHHPR